MSKRQELSGGSTKLQSCGIPSFYTKGQKLVLTQNLLNMMNVAVHILRFANQTRTKYLPD
jgi:hypothetical protein